MLIECQNCRVSFDCLLTNCVACGAPSVLSQEQRRRVCLNSINQFIKEGKEIEEVREYLAKANVFSMAEIDKIVFGAKKMRDGKAMFKAGILLSSLGLGLANGTPILLVCVLLLGGTLVVVGVCSIKAARKNLGWHG